MNYYLDWSTHHPVATIVMIVVAYSFAELAANTLIKIVRILTVATNPPEDK